jgi:hypothetical protein
VVVKQRPRRFAGWPAHICPTQPCRPACRRPAAQPRMFCTKSACRGLGALDVVRDSHNIHASVPRSSDKCSLGGQLSVCYYDSAGHQSRAQARQDLHNRLQVRCVCSTTAAETARRISRRGEFGEGQGILERSSTQSLLSDVVVCGICDHKSLLTMLAV